MIKTTPDLAEYLIFNFLLDTKCVGSADFEKALKILQVKTREAQTKLLISKQLELPDVA